MKKIRDFRSGALIFTPDPVDLENQNLKQKIKQLEQKLNKHEQLIAKLEQKIELLFKEITNG